MNGVDPPFPAAGAARPAPPGDGRGAAARRLALPSAGLVAPLPLPAPSRGGLRALAHAHRLRRRRRRASCGRRGALRALGGTRAVIDAPTAADSAVAPDADELTRLAKAHAYALGFDLAGVAALGPADTAAAFDEWIAAGH